MDFYSIFTPVRLLHISYFAVTVKISCHRFGSFSYRATFHDICNMNFQDYYRLRIFEISRMPSLEKILCVKYSLNKGLRLRNPQPYLNPTAYLPQMCKKINSAF